MVFRLVFPNLCQINPLFFVLFSFEHGKVSVLCSMRCSLIIIEEIWVNCWEIEAFRFIKLSFSENPDCLKLEDLYFE